MGLHFTQLFVTRLVRLRGLLSCGRLLQNGREGRGRTLAKRLNYEFQNSDHSYFKLPEREICSW